MTAYCFKRMEKKGVESEFEVDGEIVEVYGDSPYNRGFVALVKVPRDSNEGQPSTTDSPERVETTCATEDTDCSRTVSQEGDTCWQHE